MDTGATTRDTSHVGHFFKKELPKRIANKFIPFSSIEAYRNRLILEFTITGCSPDPPRKLPFSGLQTGVQDVKIGSF